MITHRNIIANITPIERAASQYTRYLWPLRPLRFLGLLPLSHMFGQALTVFLPPLIRATTVFIRGYSPNEIVKQIQKHRITLAVTVPRLLDLLRARVRQLASTRARVPHAALPLVRRLRRHRDAHRVFGWKFGGFVVGGAHLDSELEEFWRRLGFAVVQGYGLTETAPIVAWNNPFRTTHGTVGMPLEGVAVRIAPDGEVLVRGPASRLRLPVVPIRLEGLDRVMHRTWWWPRRGAVRVIFGPPLYLEGDDYLSLATRVEKAVVALIPEPVTSERPDAA
jgi:long-chain acyl-CoA synthetase